MYCGGRTFDHRVLRRRPPRGRRLLAEALEFCRDRGYRRVRLWTSSGLQTAGRLHAAAGFRIAQQMYLLELPGVL